MSDWLPDWNARISQAAAVGWKVVEKEYYNPGGTTYRSVLVDTEGSERGYVDKYVKSRSLGKDVIILVPDPEAAAWNELP